VFHYSDTWRLVINTGTTIITFLMVNLNQHTQNRDTLGSPSKTENEKQVLIELARTWTQAALHGERVSVLTTVPVAAAL
jgi:low affinity iron permease